jgi:cytochrome c553
MRIAIARLCAAGALFSALGLVASAALGDAKMLALGKHLSQECTACHKLDGSSKTIPPLAGLETDYFEQTMGFYRDGARDNAVMISVAKSLSAEETKALALYFGSLPKPGVELKSGATGSSAPKKK